MGRGLFDANRTRRAAASLSRVRLVMVNGRAIGGQVYSRITFTRGSRLLADHLDHLDHLARRKRRILPRALSDVVAMTLPSAEKSRFFWYETDSVSA